MWRSFGLERCSGNFFGREKWLWGRSFLFLPSRPGPQFNWIFNRVFDIQLNWAQGISCSLGQGFQLWSLPRRRPLRPQTEAPRRGSFIDHLYLSWAVWTSELWMSTKLTQNWFYSDGTEKNGTLASKSISLRGECSWTDGKKMWFTKSDKCTVHWFPVISSILYVQ